MNRKLGGTDTRINLSDLIDDAVSNAITRRNQGLSVEEAGKVTGGETLLSRVRILVGGILGNIQL